MTRAVPICAALFALGASGQTAAPASGTPRGQPLSGPALDARTQEVAELLRCPVCQGLSVADSPSTMARNMRMEVREKLAAGYDQDQVLADFERSYGEFVRLEPPMRGVNWLVWGGPVGALLLGGILVRWTLRRGPREPEAPQPVPARDALPDDARLARAVLRVREIAYGWPGGVPPGARS